MAVIDSHSVTLGCTTVNDFSQADGRLAGRQGSLGNSRNRLIEVEPHPLECNYPQYSYALLPRIIPSPSGTPTGKSVAFSRREKEFDFLHPG